MLGVALLRDAGPAEIARWDFYADRFLVWLDPAGHPHTGQQLLTGARAIHEGGWWGGDGVSGAVNRLAAGLPLVRTRFDRADWERGRGRRAVGRQAEA